MFVIRMFSLKKMYSKCLQQNVDHLVSASMCKVLHEVRLALRRTGNWVIHLQQWVFTSGIGFQTQYIKQCQYSCSGVSLVLVHAEDETTRSPNCRLYQNHFCTWLLFYFDSYPAELSSQWWNYEVSTGWHNCFARTRDKPLWEPMMA